MKRFLSIVLISAQMLTSVPLLARAEVTPLSLDSADSCDTVALEDAIKNNNDARELLNDVDLFDVLSRQKYQKRYEGAIEDVVKQFVAVNGDWCKENFFKDRGLGKPFTGLTQADVTIDIVPRLQQEARKSIASSMITSLVHEISTNYQIGLDRLIVARQLRDAPDGLERMTKRLMKEWTDQGVLPNESLDEQAQAQARLLSLQAILDSSALDSNIAVARQYALTTRLMATAMDASHPWNEDALEKPDALFRGSISGDNEQMTALYDRPWMDPLRGLYRIIADGGDAKQEFEFEELAKYYVSRDFELQSIVQRVADKTVNQEKGTSLNLGAITFAADLQQEIVADSSTSEAARRILVYAKANDAWAREQKVLAPLSLGATLLSPALAAPTWALRAEAVYVAITDLVAYGGLTFVANEVKHFLNNDEQTVPQRVVEELTKIGLAIPTGELLRTVFSNGAKTGVQVIKAMSMGGSPRRIGNKRGAIIIMRPDEARWGNKEVAKPVGERVVPAPEPNAAPIDPRKGVEPGSPEVDGAEIEMETTKPVDVAFLARNILKKVKLPEFEPDFDAEIIPKTGRYAGKQFSRQAMYDMGLAPRHFVKVEGKTFIFSRIFQADESVYAAYLYVPTAGGNSFEVVPVLTSNTQGGLWRMMPYHGKGGWKGGKISIQTENGLALVSQLQEYLSGNIQEDLLVTNQTIAREERRYALYGPSATSHSLRWTDYNARYFRPWNNAPQQTIDVSQLDPTVVREWKVPSGLYGGDVTMRVYALNDGSGLVTVGTDPKGNMFFVGTEQRTAELSALGVRNGYYSNVDFLTPGLEYSIQAKHVDESPSMITMDETMYLSQWEFIRQHPFLQKLSQKAFQPVTEAMIASYRYRQQLFDAIYRMGVVVGPRKNYSAEELVTLINRIVHDKQYPGYRQFDLLPRTNGIRDKVTELFQKYGEKMSPD